MWKIRTHVAKQAVGIDMVMKYYVLLGMHFLLPVPQLSRPEKYAPDRREEVSKGPRMVNGARIRILSKKKDIEGS